MSIHRLPIDTKHQRFLRTAPLGESMVVFTISTAHHAVTSQDLTQRSETCGDPPVGPGPKRSRIRTIHVPPGDLLNRRRHCPAQETRRERGAHCPGRRGALTRRLRAASSARGGGGARACFCDRGARRQTGSAPLGPRYFISISLVGAARAPPLIAAGGAALSGPLNWTEAGATGTSEPR